MKEEVTMRQTMTSLDKDFIASHLRSQVNTLQRLLEEIQNVYGFEFDYALESLKRVESSIRRLRNYLHN